MLKKILSMIVLVYVLTSHSELAKANSAYSQILPMMQRAAFIDDIIEKRVKTLLPQLMNEHDMDMWILISREYNEDPILKTLLPATWLSARRTTILVFARENKKTVNSYAIGTYKVGDMFEKAWDKQKHPNQWQALQALVVQYDPKNIGINQSDIWAHADGLVATDKKDLMKGLSKKYQKRLVSAEPLAVSWLEQRIPDEMKMYEHIVAIAHSIIAEAFSRQVITPGKTTTEEVVWWLRERVRELRLQAWFHPTIGIQRKSDEKFDHLASFTNKSNVIQVGDLLHVDFGITYLRLNTDTQQHAYVLKPGETSAPVELVEAFKRGNKLQDIFTNNFAAGKTGNQVLKESRQMAIEQGLKPSIYTHPLGYHGHGAGTTLGMWDSQGGVPGDGDYPLHYNTVYSIELNNAMFIKAWDKEIRIMLEENALFDKNGVTYIDGRQQELILIK